MLKSSRRMSLNWTVGTRSPSFSMTSTSAESTPPIHSSQECCVNTLIDSVVPRTPNIINLHYSADQCVPHTPAGQAFALSPLNVILTPRTPLTPLNAVSPTYSILYFDNQDDKSDIDTGRDQRVPSMPQNNALEPCTEKSCDDSQTSTVPQKNNYSCMGHPFSYRETLAQSNDMTKHKIIFTRKLSLKSGKTTSGCVTNVQNSTSENTSKDIHKHSSSTSKNSSNSSTSCRQIPLVDDGDQSQIISETAAVISTSVSSTERQALDSLAKVRAHTIHVSPEVPIHHTRNMTYMQRRLALTEGAGFCQSGNVVVPCNSSAQLQLFDGNEIFNDL